MIVIKIAIKGATGSMQVFEFFTYNLKDIRFKNTKDYFDDLLKELNINYTDIMFCFRGDFSGDCCRKVKKAFVRLSEYVEYLKQSERHFSSPPEYCLSSVKNINGQIEKYIKAEHKDDFCSLLKKIPNPINFAFMGVVLDNVNWYENECQNPVFCSKDQEINCYDHKFCSYYSNSIRLFKEFDYGNKLNLVELVIERKFSQDDLEPYPDAFNEILKKLGKPYHKSLRCVFSEDERKKWSDSSKALKALIEEDHKSEETSQNIRWQETDEEYLNDALTPIGGFSPKTSFNKAAKPKGFKYYFYSNGCYRYQFKNSYNHIFLVEFMNIPFSSFFEASISVEGYNFHHTLRSFQRATVKDSFMAQSYAEEVFTAAEKAVNEYGEKLFSSYGQTPKWYTK